MPPLHDKRLVQQVMCVASKMRWIFDECMQQRGRPANPRIILRSMLPKTLAVIDDDDEFRDYLCQYLRERGLQVGSFRSGDDLLASPGAFGFDFYVIDLTLPGIDGVDLLVQLRQRTSAGVVVTSGRTTPDVFEVVMNAEADMYLAKPVRFEQVEIAIRAVQRRTAMLPKSDPGWSLDSGAKVLVAPDDSRIALSEADVTILECFAEAGGAPVPRAVLRSKLGYPDADDSDNTLTATIYRLRRRIEKVTQGVVPLQSQSRVGYVFKAKLAVV